MALGRAGGGLTFGPQQLYHTIRRGAGVFPGRRGSSRGPRPSLTLTDPDSGLAVRLPGDVMFGGSIFRPL
jgi:hypothetical protein